MVRVCIFLACIITCCSCLNKKAANGAGNSDAFDNTAYFEREAARLNRAGKSETKSARRNGTFEQKEISRPDWKIELAMFSQSVINKPSWKGKYRYQKQQDLERWSATEPGLRTRSISISRRDDKVLRVLIINSTDNSLYSSNEELTYFPDSLYRINKTQKVRFLEEDSYEVTGKIKN